MLDCELVVVLVGVRIPDSGTVVGAPPLDPEFEAWAWEGSEREARESPDEQLRKIRAEGGKVSRPCARVGRPDAEILAAAEKAEAGLIVVGSRGLGPLRRAVMGSVSRGVVRYARCPVLVVRGAPADPFSGPVIVGVDGSGESLAAARAAAEICAAAGVALHVVFVMRAERYRPQAGPEAWEGWRANLERAARDARSWIERQAGELRAEGAAKSVEAHLVSGVPEREIPRLAEGLGAGLVVVGARGLGVVRRMLLGSVSDSLVRHALASVMVVHAPGRRAGG